MVVVPYKISPGTYQLGTLASATAGAFTKVGAQTYAILIAVEASTATYALVSTDATASSTVGFPIKSSDPPIILGCAPGTVVSWFGEGTGVIALAELSH